MYWFITYYKRVLLTRFQLPFHHQGKGRKKVVTFLPRVGKYLKIIIFWTEICFYRVNK
jgi:hypothetical protein